MTQLEKEIHEAILFLRVHNHTIPSTTLEDIKHAALWQLHKDLGKGDR